SLPPLRSSDLNTSLSLHDALPISLVDKPGNQDGKADGHRQQTEQSYDLDCHRPGEKKGDFEIENDEKYGHQVVAHIEAHAGILRSEEHTSELQSRFDLVCRLLTSR